MVQYSLFVRIALRDRRWSLRRSDSRGGRTPRRVWTRFARAVSSLLDVNRRPRERRARFEQTPSHLLSHQQVRWLFSGVYGTYWSLALPPHRAIGCTTSTTLTSFASLRVFLFFFRATSRNEIGTSIIHNSSDVSRVFAGKIKFLASGYVYINVCVWVSLCVCVCLAISDSFNATRNYLCVTRLEMKDRVARAADYIFPACRWQADFSISMRKGCCHQLSLISFHVIAISKSFRRTYIGYSFSQARWSRLFLQILLSILFIMIN